MTAFYTAEAKLSGNKAAIFQGIRLQFEAVIVSTARLSVDSYEYLSILKLICGLLFFVYSRSRGMSSSETSMSGRNNCNFLSFFPAWSFTCMLKIA